MTSYAFIGAVSQGLVYGLMALGVFLTFRILDFPDLTVDGSLPLGAAVSAMGILAGLNPYVSLIPAVLAGFLAGVVTGVLAARFGILHLLASILTMTALYSINLRVMGNRPNISLIGQPTVFEPLKRLGLSSSLAALVFFLIVLALAWLFLVWLMRTEFGQALQATGDNPKMIASLGVNVRVTVIVGVGLSNALVALAGALVAQNQGLADVSLGVGTIVVGLASAVVGGTIVSGRRSMAVRIAAVALGSVVYRLAVALALQLKIGSFSFNPSDLNLITSILVIGALLVPKLRAKPKPLKSHA
ncbi:MAG: ABC transporter permease [Deltaproteobacteria bacterium]|nr:ABC transporter permease [Deltaproteobacteria bacterium]